MPESSQSTYRWYILSLAAATHIFAVAMPSASMPVLFKEISEDLGLSLVQIGAIWGIASLAGIFIALMGGLLGDRFGVKRILGATCLLAGLAGALRGLSDDFAGLMASVFLFGLLTSIIPVNVHKTASIWFHGRHLGLANGVVSLGMGIGFTFGAMLSATILSPLLGGWRNVLFLYGAVSIVISMLWFLTGRDPAHVEVTGNESRTVPFRQAISQLVRIKPVWFLGLILMGRMGATRGLTGYLPLYLRENGWPGARADGTLAALNGASTMAVIPLTILSDRFGLRKAILLPAMIVTTVGLSLIPVANDTTMWALAILMGIPVDAFMAVFITMLQETEGVGPKYAGTALGLVFTLSRIGAFIAPPLGNSLADINLGLPFAFWATLSALALVGFYFMKEPGRRGR